MTYWSINFTTYDNRICFQSVRTLLAKQTGVKKDNVPFTANQYKKRWNHLCGEDNRKSPDIYDRVLGEDTSWTDEEVWLSHASSLHHV